jgi:rhodanese-related sulfurtransferase
MWLMRVRGAVSIPLGLVMLAFSGCSSGDGGGPSVADAATDAAGDPIGAPDMPQADEGGVADAAVPPELRDAGPDEGTDVAVAPEPTDGRPEGGNDGRVAADLVDAFRGEGREAGMPSDVVEGGRDSERDVGAGQEDLASAGDTSTARPWPTGKYISVDEVYARLQAQDPDMLLVNVVDEEYYNLGFIAGSLKIPWDTLQGRLDELDPARHIVLYCRRGVRSEAAYTTLVENDFPLVWVMEGSLQAWSAAGYPVVPE